MRKFSNWLQNVPQKLRRITSTGVYRPEIDGLRFFAIFFVIIWHFSERVSRAIGDSINDPDLSDRLTSHVGDGFAGSAIFFAISAFVLLTQFKKHNGSLRAKFLKDYFRRRLLRIEPPYVLLLAGTYLAIHITGYTPKFTKAFSESDVPLGESLLASVFYLHNILYNSMPRLFIPGWSLEIEVQFYILAPLLFAGYVSIRSQKARLIVDVIAIILSGILAYAVSFTSHGRYLFFTLVSQFEFFWIGVLAFELLTVNWFNALWRRKIITDCIAVLSLLGIELVSTKANVSIPFLFEIIFFPILLVALFAAATHGKLFKAFCSNPWISLIGAACYSFYLTHMQIMTLITGILSPFIPDTNIVFQIIIYAIAELPLLLIGGLFYYYFLERPFMVKDWPGKWLRFILRKQAR
jgi:peptidoglycan/LPS O-acetylase OafA/YrhL